MARPVLRLPLNTKGRDIVVGDVHGAFSSLEYELSRIGFNEATDRLICVGDLVDRGRESELAPLWLKNAWFYSVLGNHDVSLTLSTRDQVPVWMPEDDRECADRHMCHEHGWFRGLSELNQQRIVAALAELPLAIEIESDVGPVGIVHASVPRDLTWPQFLTQLETAPITLCAIEPLLWDRQDAADAMPLAQIGSPVQGEPRTVEGVTHVFHGHNLNPDRTVWRLGNRYFIETGGWLRAARPDIESRMRNPARWTLVDVRYPGNPL